jgi:hypothetical protein
MQKKKRKIVITDPATNNILLVFLVFKFFGWGGPEGRGGVNNKVQAKLVLCFKK